MILYFTMAQPQQLGTGQTLVPTGNSDSKENGEECHLEDWVFPTVDLLWGAAHKLVFRNGVEHVKWAVCLKC